MRLLTFFLFLAALLTPLAADAKASHPKKDAAPKKEAMPPASPVQVGDHFGFCILEFGYADQRKLTLAMSPLHQLNLGVSVPNAGFTKNEQYDLAYGFDGKADKKIRAKALNETTILLQLEVNPPFAQAIAKAKTLDVGGGDHLMTFNVAPLHRSIEALSDCVAKNKGKTNDAAQLPPSLSALLAAAGMKDIKPVSLAGVPLEERPADFLWRTGNLVGGVLELKAPADKDMATLVGMYVDGLKKRCAGPFKADVGADKKLPDMVLRPALVSCQPKADDPKSKIVESLLFSFSETRQLTVFTHEGDAAHEAEAVAARDAIAKIIIETPPVAKPAKH